MKFIVGGLGNWFKDYKQVYDMIINADNLGFYGAIFPDHYMWGKMGGRLTRPDRFVTSETWMTIAYLLAKTEQIHLGSLVTPIPFRPPGMMAKMVASVDNLSNGRTIFGVGAGWSEEEFKGYSTWDEPKIRVNKTKEGLELIIKLWTEDEVTFTGSYYQAEKAVLEPKPVQKPYPKLLFGGSGDRMLAMAGQYGDIVYIPPWNGLEKVQEGRKKVLKSAKRWNREEKINFMSGTMMGAPVTEMKEFTKLIESAVTNGDKYFLPTFGTGEKGIELLKTFAKEVLPSFQ